MSWTTCTVYNFADDLHWPELGILLESIDYHEAARKVWVQYINYVIKTDIPRQSDVELYELVKRLQTHSHSKYLKKTFIWSF